jgi:two-component system, NarL family, nitrate/nitrite response regulator NarL
VGADADESDLRGGVRLVLVEDHRFFRQGLRELLEDHGHVVVGEAATGREGVRVAREQQPDVIVLDLNLPGPSGLEVIRDLREAAPEGAILVMTMSAASADVETALTAGAAGYVLKDAPVDEMLAGLEAVVRGQVGVSPQVAALLVERLRSSAPEPDAAPDRAAPELSERERAILRGLVAGRANAEIAAEMHLSVGTVKADLAALQARFGVDNRVSLAVEAVRLGLA